MHIGMWFNTWQRAFEPHEPGHGSLHFSLIQATLLGQSAFIVHSGLQFGGDPIYDGRHVHEGEPP